MARQERLINNAATTLNGGISAGATSLVVNSATDFPTEGDFRLIIGTEILLVTAVSGATFTVERGAENSTAATHSNSDAVTAIVTKGALDQFRRDADPWADVRPPFRIVDTNGDYLTSSSFTEVNFTDGAVSTNPGGNITITKNDHAATSISALVRTAPSTPYTITACVSALMYTDTTVSGPYFGLLFRENATGELVGLSLHPGNTGEKSYRVLAYASPTTAPSLIGETRPLLQGMPVWLRIEDDGVDLKFYASEDGVNYQFLVSRTRTTDFTTDPDEIGFFIDNEAGRDDGAHVSLVAWDGE